MTTDGLLCVGGGDAEVFLQSEAGEEGRYPWLDSLRMRAGVGLDMWNWDEVSRRKARACTEYRQRARRNCYPENQLWRV